MRISNVHSRRLRCDPQQVSPLLAQLASVDDRLWPADRWPPMRFEEGLRVGARGGHGPVRYRVAAIEPGQRIWFEFTGEQLTRGFVGGHGFETASDGGATVLTHRLETEIGWWAWVRWIVAVRWLHDALIEDALDRAEAELGQRPSRPARWSAWVRFLRWTLRPRKKAPRNT